MGLLKRREENMTDLLLSEAETVVKALRLEGILQELRHDLRQKLFEAFVKHSREPILFAGDGIRIADALITVGTTRENIEQILPDVEKRHASCQVQTRVLIGRYVLLYLLNHAVDECVNDVDDWHQMESVIRDLTFDYGLFESEVVRITRDVLGLEPWIKEDLPNLRVFIEAKYRKLEESSFERAIEEFAGLRYCGMAIILSHADCRGFDLAISQLEEQTHDRTYAQHLLSMYVIHFVLIRLRTDEPSSEAFHYFRSKIIEECRKRQ